MNGKELKVLRSKITKADKLGLAERFGLKYGTVNAILRGDRPGDQLIIEAGVIVADRLKAKKELIQFISEEV